MKVIFWNTKDIEDFDIILSILEDENPHFLFLSEFKKLDISSHYSDLFALNYNHLPNPGCNKIKIIKKVSLKNIELTIQHNDYSGIFFPTMNLNIISVHMPSQMHYEFDALKYNILKFKQDFEKNIGNTDQENILIIGDFNVNPYESPMINFDGLAATNTTKFKSNKSFRGYENFLYYNPTWKLYSKTHFPGTFRKPRPSNTSFDVLEHHFLDQVVLSKKLMKLIKNEDIDIIHSTSKFNIFDFIKNKINYSDHLPIKYNFEI